MPFQKAPFVVQYEARVGMSDPLQVDLTTLIEVSPLLGNRLEDRTALRMSQDEALGQWFLNGSQTQVPNWREDHSFSFGCIDFLVEDAPEGRRFVPIEFNGTGTGGVSNILAEAFHELEAELSCLPNAFECTDSPLILMPYYHPSRLMFEKVLLAQAIKHGMQGKWGEGRLVGLDAFLENPTWTPGPAVVIASLKDLSDVLVVDGSTGGVSLAGRPVVATFHDVFCQNFIDRYQQDPNQPNIDLTRFYPINRFYPVCSDKSLINPLFNQYLAENPNPAFPKSIGFERANTEEALVQVLEKRLSQGQKSLIKPHGGGIGTGIEFFLEPISAEAIRAVLKASVAAMGKTYGTHAQAYPYTVCDFVDAAAIQTENYPLKGHKYELRVVVYRSRDSIKAFPTHVKVSPEAYDPAINSRHMLMNNHVGGSDPRHSALFRQALCRRETLDVLGISDAQMLEMCRFTTGFVANLVRQCIEQPTCFETSSFLKTAT